MRLYLLRLGTIPGLGAPVPGYLLRCPDGTNVLVDTGPAAGSGVETEPADDPVARLAELGLSPDDVHVVICSHLDPDHAGNHHRFPLAEFVVQADHLDLARAGAVPRLGVARESWDARGLRYREVHGDTELLPGVELIASPGHVAGHQSVLVRLPEHRPVLLAADAVPTVAAADPEQRPVFPFDIDEVDVRESTRKLVNLAEKEDALLVCGHDVEQWSTLRIAPEYYA